MGGLSLTDARQRRLLSIIELGGYPNLQPLYQQLGFRVDVVNSQRKARSLLKKDVPDVIVAEYIFQSDFRDRTSNLESLMAVLQRHPEVKLVVFYLPEQAEKLALLEARFPLFAKIPLPLTAEEVEAVLRRAIA
jgi:DNA-binding NtrC family response regulator